MMHERIKHDMDIRTDRDTVRLVLKELDPEGVKYGGP